MSIFKKLRSWYYELWDYIDESEAVLINEAYLKFEAICKKMGLIQSQY